MAVKIEQILRTLGRAVAHVVNAYQTDGHTPVSSNAVMGASDAEAITRAFLDVQEAANAQRTTGQRPSVLGVHLIQPFKPGEVGPDKLHEPSVELIEAVTGDDCQYVVATHVDRHHIHNHIIFNPCPMVTLKRWRSPRGRPAELRALSDESCRQKGLSVIAEPGRDAVSLGEAYARVRGASTKDNLRALIDDAVVNVADMVDNGTTFCMFLSANQTLPSLTASGAAEAP